jgi:hypothetical protein
MVRLDVRTGCGYRHLTWLGGFWSLPDTLLGLLFALASASLPHPVQGLLVAEASHGLARWFLTRRGFGAITFGRVIVSTTPLTPHLLMHESHHVRQYEVLGPTFIPYYLWLQARSGYAHNQLELEAEACAVASDALSPVR